MFPTPPETQRHRRHLAGLALVLLTSFGCRPAQPPTEVVAVYESGTVTRQEYVSWLLYKGLGDEPAQRQQNFLNIALTEFLAAAARAKGFLEQPVVEAALRVREAQILEKELQRHVGEGAPWESLRSELMAGVRYDLRRAQLVSTLDGQQVIEFPEGGGLDLGQVRAWLRLRNARVDPADLPSEQFQKLAKVMAFQARVRERARQLGLAERPEVVAALTWGKEEILLAEETKARVQARYRPPTETDVRARFATEAGKLGEMTFEEARPQVQDLLRREFVKAIQRALQEELTAQLAVRPPNQEK